MLGAVAARVYGDPSGRLKVIGITGTNGKTTTAYLVEAGLAAAGLRHRADRHRADPHPRPRRRRPRRSPPSPACARRPRRRPCTRCSRRWPSRGVRGRHGGLQPRPRARPGRRRPLRRRRLHQPRPRPPRLPRRPRGLLPGQGAALRRPRAPPRSSRSTTRPAAGWPAPRRRRRDRRRSPAPADWARDRRRSPAPDGGSTFTPARPRRAHLAGPAAAARAFNVANAVLAVALLDAVGVPVDDRAGRARRAPSCPAAWSRSTPASRSSPSSTTRTRPTRSPRRWPRCAVPPPGRVITVLGCGGDRDPGKRAADGRRRGRAAATCSWSPTTTRAPRTRPRSAPRCSPASRTCPRTSAPRCSRSAGRRDALAAAVALARPGRRGARRRQGPRDRPGGRRHRAPVRRPRRAARGPGGGGLPERTRGIDRADAWREVAGCDRRSQLTGDAGPPRAVTGDGHARLAHRRRPATCSSRCRGSGSTATTTSARPPPPAPSRALATRADDALPCVVVDDPVAALGRLAAGVHARLDRRRPGDPRHHRLLRQDLHQGPARPGAGRGRADGQPARLVQQRHRPAAHRADADATTRFLVLEMGARGPGHIARLCADRPAARSASCSTSARPTWGVRQPRGDRRRPRASWSRRCPPTAPPCSTPTTRGCSAWPRAPRPAC